MIEEVSYSSLAEGKLPKIPNTKPYVSLCRERLKALRSYVNTSVNNLTLVRSKSKPVKDVAITNAVFEGYRYVFRDIYVIRGGDTLTFRATYEYRGLKPTLKLIQQSIDDEEKLMYVLFPPKSTYELEVVKSVQEPKYIVCKSVIKPVVEVGKPGIIELFREGNELSLTYPVGVLDDRYKPLDEYPTSGTQNVALDIAYAWRVQNIIYPQPLPEGLEFTDLNVEFISGFIIHEGKYYKDPTTNNTVRIKYRVVNRTGGTLRISHWGLPITVMYEDDRHISQADISISFKEFSISNNSSVSQYLDVNLPEWAYGKVAIAHALNVYRDGMYIYGGGPFYCFEVFRLRLP